MNQDETIALFLRCEEARKLAREAALEAGTDKDAAYANAHEAAKTVWNGWTETMIAERKALVEKGEWAAEKNFYGWLEPQNQATKEWMDRAAADFSSLRFEHPALAQEKEAQTRENKENRQPPGAVIEVEGDIVDFSGFVFPGEARFGRAKFRPLEARFWGPRQIFQGLVAAQMKQLPGGAQFSGTAWFDKAHFSCSAWFSGAQFSGDAGFQEAQFSGTAWFDRAQFSGSAWFGNA